MSEAGLRSIEGGLKAAVAAQIASGDESGESARELCISPERACESLLDADLSRFEERVADVAGRLGLDALSTEVLWLCAAPELDERYGRVFAFLLDTTTRRLPTPRLIVAALAREDADADAILACLGAEAPLRRLGCVRPGASDPALPLID